MDDVVRKNDELSEHFTQVSVLNLLKLADRTRRIIRILAVVIIVNVVLTVSVTVGGAFLRQTVLDVKQNTSQVEQNARALKIECRVGNTSDAKQLQVWNYVLQLSINDAPSEAEKERQAAMQRRFLAYLKTVFVARDCSKVP